MTPGYRELSVTAQTGYAQLLDAALALQHRRSVADLPGSFNIKVVKGRRYVYFQYTEPAGRLRQVYVGPENEAVQRLMQRGAGSAITSTLEPLARSAIALGCLAVVPRQFRVIRRLADYGFFQAGGILIGTHAFLAAGNMLGVRWLSQDSTQDLDFAHAGRSLSLLLPGTLEARTGDAIESLSMGFLPISGLRGKSGATWLVPDDPAFRLDFLTPLHRKGDEPFAHPALGITLQPLPFMEFSLQGVEQAAILGTEGAVVVNVPDPARFALHKLLVAGERSGSFATKSAKDVIQAACLLAWLADHRTEHLQTIHADLCSRGAGWTRRFHSGLRMLETRFPGHPALRLLKD